MTRDALPFPLPVAAVDAIIEPEDGDALRPRQCGRCRMMFEGDPTLDTRVRNNWALCPACEASLLPTRARRGNVIAFRRPEAITGKSRRASDERAHDRADRNPDRAGRCPA